MVHKIMKMVVVVVMNYEYHLELMFLNLTCYLVYLHLSM
jgi:hypothetical protein